jgi:hypothetical protein
MISNRLAHHQEFFDGAPNFGIFSSTSFCCSEVFPTIPDSFQLNGFFTLSLRAVLAGMECYQFTLGESLRTFLMDACFSTFPAHLLQRRSCMRPARRLFGIIHNQESPFVR